jgi:hypothetical protein
LLSASIFFHVRNADRVGEDHLLLQVGGS